jgi:hypothetical protein
MLLIASKVYCKELERFLDPGLKLRVNEILTIDPYSSLRLCSITFNDCWKKEDDEEFHDHICGCRQLIENIDRSKRMLRSMVSELGNLVYLVVISATPFTLSQSLITVFDSPVLAMWMSLENELNFDFMLEIFARGCFNSLIGSIHLDLPLIPFPKLLKDLISSKKDWLEKIDIHVEELGPGLLIMRSSIPDKTVCQALETLYED